MGNALAPNAKLRPGLRALGYFQRRRFPLQSGNGLLHAQGRLGHIQRQGIEQVVLLPVKKGVGLHRYLNIQVARRPALTAGVALAGQAHRHSVLNAGGDVDQGRPAAPFHPAAAAVGARGFNNAAPALAGGTGGNLGELTEQAALGAPHLPLAAASGAGIDRRARFAAVAGAVVADFDAGNGHFPGHAKGRFLESKGQLLLEVAAALRPPGPAAAGIAEKGVENIPETAENIKAVKGAVKAVAVDPGVAEPVILGALLGVGQHLVGFVDFLELLLGPRILVPVGMKLHRLAAESPADFLLGILPGDA